MAEEDLDTTSREKTWYEMKGKILVPLGIHARVAMDLVNLAKEYDGETKMVYKGREYNLKSIMNMMTAAALAYTSVVFKIEEREGSEELANGLIRIISEQD
ncbi:phosphocarrier protein HPr [Candidatus Pacearchaeota archaeon]|nr:phosphocarrier protein HPr [Candidatus Pacearchaeota archaeon]|tara:strand:- start:414 stop:716 length:303 start_codon:yes stop_codon:yes gene_type:complete